MDGHIGILILLYTITHPSSYHDFLTLCLTDTVAHKANTSQFPKSDFAENQQIDVPPRTIAYPNCTALDGSYNHPFSPHHAAVVLSPASLLLLNHER